MLNFHLPVPEPFHFRDVVFSHGWLRLLPYRWEEETETLSRVDRLTSGRRVRWEMRADPGGVAVSADAAAESIPELASLARWVLAVEDRLEGFHDLCREEPGLRTAGERGQGRILRCPTVWEDLVKTLFSVNTTWRQTISMTEKLVTLCGEAGTDGEWAFPSPETVAELEPDLLQRECRVGYRAEPLSRLARAVAEGAVDLESLKDPSLPDTEVERRLLALRGIGPYAAANVMMLLARYDHLPVDSWLRKTVRDGWFGGEAVPDREILTRFERFRPYRTLVYRFYDWEGAMRTGVWTNG